MIIGRSRIGRGRIGRATVGPRMQEVVASITVLGYRSPYVMANLSIIDVDYLDVAVGLDIIPYSQRLLSTSLSILARVPIPIEAGLSIAARRQVGATVALSIITTALRQAKTSISILGSRTRTVMAALSILGRKSTSADIGLSVAERIECYADTSLSVSAAIDTTVDAALNVSDARFNAFNAAMDIIDNRYWALGPIGDLIDLSGKVADPAPAGFGAEMNSIKPPSGRYADITPVSGRGAEYSFILHYLSDNDRVEMNKAIDQEAEDLYILHTGRSDRFYYIHRVIIDPLRLRMARGPTQRITCKLVDPCMYHAWDQGQPLGICVLPYNTPKLYNFGSAISPLLFRIRGNYAGGKHLENLAVQAWNTIDEGEALKLSDRLLSNETIELDAKGYLRFELIHRYTDEFTFGYWANDTARAGCTQKIGYIDMPSGGWFYYTFSGPNPLKKNIQLTVRADITGSPGLFISSDPGASPTTWKSVGPLLSGIHTYPLVGSEKLATVHVLFSCPTGSAKIDYVDFKMVRDISMQYNHLPECPPKDYRRLRVTGGGSGRAEIVTAFRSRWHAQ